MSVPNVTAIHPILVITINTQIFESGSKCSYFVLIIISIPTVSKSIIFFFSHCNHYHIDNVQTQKHNENEKN